jgi:hypothetical protein
LITSAFQCVVEPQSSKSYQVQVTDSRGEKQVATVEVVVDDQPIPLEVDLTANPTRIKSGELTQVTLAISGGQPPYTCQSSESKFHHNKTTQTMLQAPLSPKQTTKLQVHATDKEGEQRTATIDIVVDQAAPSELNAEGPLTQALDDLWEKARKAKVKSVGTLIIRFYEAPATWKVHQSLATLNGTEVQCEFQAELEADGIESLRVEYAGNLAKAQGIRSFLEPQIRSANDHSFDATYTLMFSQPGLASRWPCCFARWPP